MLHSPGRQMSDIAPAQGGAPCIVGTRIPVATIVSMLAEGSSVSEVLADFPQLTAVAVSAAVQFAADAVRERELPLPA